MYNEENNNLQPDENEDQERTYEYSIRPNGCFTVFLIFICLFCIFNNIKSFNVKFPQSPETTTTTTIVDTAHVNESVKNSKFEIVFTEAKLDFKDYSPDTIIPEGYKVIQAVFNFKNVSEKDQEIDIFECYADNVKCEQFYYVDNYIDPIGQNVSPGRELTNATIYFIVLENTKEIEIEYERNSYTDDKFFFIAQENKKEKTKET